MDEDQIDTYLRLKYGRTDFDNENFPLDVLINAFKGYASNIYKQHTMNTSIDERIRQGLIEYDQKISPEQWTEKN